MAKIIKLQAGKVTYTMIYRYISKFFFLFLFELRLSKNKMSSDIAFSRFSGLVKYICESVILKNVLMGDTVGENEFGI